MDARGAGHYVGRMTRFTANTAYVAALFVLLVTINAGVDAVPAWLLIASAVGTGCVCAAIVTVFRRPRSETD